MIPVSTQVLADAIGAKLIGEASIVDTVSTDTRSIQEGSLFIALVGERFDAHDFCQQAKEKGAGALLVNRPVKVDIPQILVNDTRLALGEIASWVHQQCDVETLAITGSCGKTTVKEMTAAILSQKGTVLSTAGNFNNDIGVPLTLLRAKHEHDYAVIELGANHIGEIAYTTDLVKPSVALVNNVAAAHLEGFGSIDGVKQAKGEIYQGLSVGDTAIINLDSNGEHFWQQTLSTKRVLSFSEQNPSANFYASDIQLNKAGYASFMLHSPQGEAKVTLSLLGRHNVANALAATALCMEFGASLEEVVSGLTKVVNAKGRVELEVLSDKLTMIDDSYNASVPAMKAAIDLLSTFKGTRWLVLGYMAELGEETLELHRQVGEHAAQFNFEHVLTFGSDAKVISDICNGQNFSTHDELIEYIEVELEKVLDTAHTVLIKGANGARMSTVAKALKEKHQ